MDYALLKTLHIISATVLFGTGIGTACVMFIANRSGNIAAIRFAAAYVVKADWLFTTPAVILQPLTGALLLRQGGYALSDAWLALSVALYLFVFACWVPVVFIQYRMRAIAEQCLREDKQLPARYRRLEMWWIFLGSLAFPAMIAVFWLMTAKPAGLFL